MRKGRIYIIPTRFGLAFILGACVMLLVGATYQNNLVNLLAFFMLSLIFVAMVQTHNNLKDITVEALDADSSFSGSEFVITAVLHNNSKTPRFNLGTDLRKRVPEVVYENVLPLLPHGSIKLRSAYKAKKRGHYRIDEIKVSTVYPLGLFYAWIWLNSKGDYFVYPEPKGHRSFPLIGVGQEATHAQRSLEGEDFHGHRKFDSGDSPRHIDWKAHARGRPLMIKQFTEGTASAVWFEWNALEGLETEEKLSQLAAWIEEARKRRLPFGLKTPAGLFEPGHGLQHATRCLEHLAVYGLPPTRGKNESVGTAVG